MSLIFFPGLFSSPTQSNLDPIWAEKQLSLKGILPRFSVLQQDENVLETNLLYTVILLLSSLFLLQDFPWSKSLQHNDQVWEHGGKREAHGKNILPLGYQ